MSARVLGRRVLRRRPLHGGCIAEVARLDLEGGLSVVEKRQRPGQGGDLALEAWMLRYLAGNTALPVPEVLAAAPERLLLAWVEHAAGGATAEAQADAARHLAALHGVTSTEFGFERDTLIGPLPQVNTPTTSWLAFFREHRLLAMTRRAQAAGRLPAAFAGRLEELAARLDRLIDEPAAPALLHGDVWSGNLLFARGRVAAFLDPALSFGHPEMDLAFPMLFGPFERPFYDAYAEIAGIAPGFFEMRAALYNLYPLLVHVLLFGAGYLAPIDRTLRRHGL